jgi:sugar-specific transcriptional regulator TrmB
MSGQADPVTQAVETLQSFELTEYEAKCFVALTRIESGSAKEISEVADVPQARVYDCMDTLAERGLADIQHSKPRRFRAASPDEATSTLERAYRDRLDRLEDLLPRLEAPEPRGEVGDIWTTEGSAEVGDRIAALLEEADDTVLLAVAAQDLLTESVVDALADAVDRGVAVTVGSPAAAIRDSVSTALPSATVVETWTWWESHPVQPGAMTAVVLVDDHSLLVSADDAASLPDVPNHRAVWTDSEAAPLVSLLTPLLRHAIVGPE